MKDLKDIKFWLFDLDNTLYDGATKVFDQVDKKMSEYISTKLNISKAEARKIQQQLGFFDDMVGTWTTVYVENKLAHKYN